jgi:hypothetical protein
VGTLASLDTYTYRIASDGTIIDVSDNWDRFASRNGAPELTADSVRGRVLWRFIDDPDTVHLYKLMVERSHATGLSITVPLRCDGPTVRRFLELTLRPLPGGVSEFASRILRTEPRPKVTLLDRHAGPRQELIKVCSWCKRVLVDASWLEVEAAMPLVRPFASVALPQVTHGMCPPCYEVVMARLQQRTR